MLKSKWMITHPQIHLRIGKSMEIVLNDITAAKLLPFRDECSHKGNFGKAFAYIGSKKFLGAAHLALEAILRGGCGYTELAGEDEVVLSLLNKFPEAIYTHLSSTPLLTDTEYLTVCKKSSIANATLIGCGSDVSLSLANLTLKLLDIETENPIILDADALNSIARYSPPMSAIRASKRPVILTPHEMEFSRITDIPIDKIRSNRIEVAEQVSQKLGCVIVLKGHNTVITDGKRTYVNPTGSTALAKGGSGDALAGLLTSLVASSAISRLELTALACYVHGAAADSLAQTYSDYGVTPSDLPHEMAKTMKRLSDLKAL